MLRRIYLNVSRFFLKSVYDFKFEFAKFLFFKIFKEKPEAFSRSNSKQSLFQSPFYASLCV